MILWITLYIGYPFVIISLNIEVKIHIFFKYHRNLMKEQDLECDKRMNCFVISKLTKRKWLCNIGKNHRYRCIEYLRERIIQNKNI